MARGNRVIVTANPRGIFQEGVISGTPKPGQCVLPKSVASDGTITWEPYGATAKSGNHGIGADGDRAMVAVLLPDLLQGRTIDDAYVDGDRCFVYSPVPGETLNMLYQNESGTGDDVAVGNNLMLDDGTGKVMLLDTDAEAEPFIALEALADPIADTHIWCMFTGA